METKNPVAREYSRAQVVLGKLKQSRIDLVLAKTDLINFIHNINYKLNALSDHAILRFGLGEIAGSLLRNEKYRKIILKLVRSEISKASFEEDVIGGWESLKSLITYKSIKFAKNLNFHTKQRERELRLKITQINADERPDQERLLRFQIELSVSMICRGV